MLGVFVRLVPSPSNDPLNDPEADVVFISVANTLDPVISTLLRLYHLKIKIDHQLCD